MRFDDFIGNLERDINAAKNIYIEKTKDINGRPLMNIRKGNKILAELGYTMNGCGKASRVVKLIAQDGCSTTICSSGTIMARHLIGHLSPHMKLTNSSLYAHQN